MLAFVLLATFSQAISAAVIPMTDANVRSRVGKGALRVFDAIVKDSGRAELITNCASKKS